MELLIVSLGSFLAGLIDSIVGGGGLILIPVLFATFPQAPPATLFGTNKSASIWGTAFATLQYSRKVDMPWRSLLPAAPRTCSRLPCAPARREAPRSTWTCAKMREHGHEVCFARHA